MHFYLEVTDNFTTFVTSYKNNSDKIIMRMLELLAPAKNLECGKAAIAHGADAVYIGAPKFGASSAASNSIEDIKLLCDYAHQFGAKVHVTVNTIIYDDELEDTMKMIIELDKVGVDALLLQDMGLLSEIRAHNLWSRELHASTQCDTRTSDKAFWLTTLGFSRIVLARELSLKEIAAIHKKVPDRELEVFVHGALCVSYSGVCYASEKCFGRSANRGECAQFCRMKFNLIDSNGQEIEHQRHLLSLKDLCQIDYLEELAEAGVSSFKIEGRLKDVNYVKNVVAAYNKKLDEIVAKHPKEYCRVSRGHVEYTFVPNLKKTFNRGFTNYFLHGRQPDIASFDTPKAMGEYVGKVKEIRGHISFNVSTLANFTNGDGLCFINDKHELEGFRVNRVEGNRLYPFRMPEHLRPGMSLYRNNDRTFEAILAHKTAQRRIPVQIELRPAMRKGENGNRLGIYAKVYILKAVRYGWMYPAGEIFKEFPLELAHSFQCDNMEAQMRKLGETIYECRGVSLLDGMEQYFVPNSVLTAIRRELMEKVNKNIALDLNEALAWGKDRMMFGNGYGFSQVGEHQMKPEEFVWTPEYKNWGYLYNIANFSAMVFYEDHGLKKTIPAFELGKDRPTAWSSSSVGEYKQAVMHDTSVRCDRICYTDGKGEALLMQCRHCIRYSLGYCVKRGGRKPIWKEPLFLELGDGRKFRLEFNCKECQMNVLSVGK